MSAMEHRQKEIQIYQYLCIIEPLDRAYVEFPVPFNPLRPNVHESVKLLYMLNWISLYLAGEEEPIAVALEFPNKQDQPITLHAACSDGIPTKGLLDREESLMSLIESLAFPAQFRTSKEEEDPSSVLVKDAIVEVCWSGIWATISALQQLIRTADDDTNSSEFESLLHSWSSHRRHSPR